MSDVQRRCGKLGVVDSAVERKSGVKTNAFYFSMTSSANSLTERQQVNEKPICAKSV
jgi:hypothetical protein